MPIENISDTARWVAAFRALESERPDALFRDPFARALAGERGFQIMRAMRGGEANTFALVIRTAVLDEIVLDVIAREQVDLVVNLAAGLDARPYRLPLPRDLRWVEADLPGIFDYKEQVLGQATPVCQLERVRVDLADAGARRALLARLGASCRKALVLTEGLLVYLPEAAVADLARDLRAQPHLALWAMEIVNPAMLMTLRLMWSDQLAEGNAKMQFGPREGAAFFHKYGWRERAVRSFADEGDRLKRGFLPRLWGVVKPLAPERFKNHIRDISTVLCLEQDLIP